MTNLEKIYYDLYKWSEDTRDKAITKCITCGAHWNENGGSGMPHVQGKPCPELKTKTTFALATNTYTGLSPAVAEMLFDIDWIREAMEEYVSASGEIWDYDDVDAIGELAYDWFIEDPETHLERMAKQKREDK